MSAAFTPGPWAVDGLSLVHGPDVSRGGQRVTVAKTIHNAGANARLIAAAPELYVALEYARKLLRIKGVEVDMLDNALAKARGEQ